MYGLDRLRNQFFGTESCPSAAKAALIVKSLMDGLKPVPFKGRVFPQPVKPVPFKLRRYPEAR
jgi:hypothetical protein